MKQPPTNKQGTSQPDPPASKPPPSHHTNQPPKPKPPFHPSIYLSILAPTVIFFDEVDALAGRRGAGEDSKASERVLSQLLTGACVYSYESMNPLKESQSSQY